MNSDLKSYIQEDVLGKHSEDGGLWIDDPALSRIMELTKEQQHDFTVLRFGFARCTTCGKVTIWKGKDRIIQ